MIFAESIPRVKYLRALAKFKYCRPDVGWTVVAPPPSAVFYHIPKWNAYMAHVPWGAGAELLGVFKLGGGAPQAAAVVLEVLKLLGFHVAKISAFAPAALNVWGKCSIGQFVELSTHNFDPALAPVDWDATYGNPDVIEMYVDLTNIRSSSGNIEVQHVL